VREDNSYLAIQSLAADQYTDDKRTAQARARGKDLHPNLETVNPASWYLLIGPRGPIVTAQRR
jgi:hypothetical protein